MTIHTPLAIRSDGAASFDENLDALLERKRKLMRDALMPAELTNGADRDDLFRETIGA